MSEYEESAGPDQTGTGRNNEGADPVQGRSRRAGASRAAGAAAAAVTSRTAGWMVAAALAGSLVTLAIDHGSSQPTAGQISIRNAGRVAGAPHSIKRNWQIQAAPLMPKRVHVGPGGPLAAGVPPALGGAWTVEPGCAIAGPAGASFQAHRPQIVIIPGAKRVVFGRRGHHHFRIQIGELPAPKRIRFVRPGCPRIPLHCRPGMKIGLRQVPPFARVQIEQRGRLFVTGPGQRPSRRMNIKFPAVVIVPSPKLTGSPGPQCVAFWSPQG